MYDTTGHGPGLAAERRIHTGWLFFALALGAFSIGTAEFASMSLVPMMAASVHVSIPDAGHAIMAYAVGVCVGAPLIALFGAGISRKTMLIGLMLFYMFGNAATAVAPNYAALLACRFLSGLPHGAYFGIAGILASSLSAPERRSQAVARVVLGLTLATIGGVPLANMIGQILGWRWAFCLIALIALTCALLVACLAPHDPPRRDASAMTEMQALRIRQVWLTLAIGAIGFGGIFCVYTYLASIMEEVTHVPTTMIPVALAVFGCGMTVGTLVCAWAADHKMMPTIGGTLLVNVAALAGFAGSAHDLYTLLPVMFMIGCGGGLATVIQARLLAVATGAESLASALNQSAFNIANALGPWLGGLALQAGLGWGSVGWVGCALAGTGFLIWLLTLGDLHVTRSTRAG